MKNRPKMACVGILFFAIGACNRSDQAPVNTLANNENAPQILVEHIAVNFANEKLNISKDSLDNDYEIRVSKRPAKNLAVCEFFSHELLGDRTVEEMFIDFGGFPDYFSVTIDTRNGEIIDFYASEM